MKQYGVDRFEENICVLVDVNGDAVEVNKEVLPIGVKEGDVLLFDGAEYRIQSDLTKEKREEARQLIDELFT